MSEYRDRWGRSARQTRHRTIQQGTATSGSDWLRQHLKLIFYQITSRADNSPRNLRLAASITRSGCMVAIALRSCLKCMGSIIPSHTALLTVYTRPKTPDCERLFGKLSRLADSRAVKFCSASTPWVGSRNSLVYFCRDSRSLPRPDPIEERHP